MKKYILFLLMIISLVDCKNRDTVISKQKLTEDEKYQFEFLKFKDKKFEVNYPISWSIDSAIMNDPHSIAKLTLKRNVGENRFIIFQIINLLDSADLKDAVYNFFAKVKPKIQQPPCDQLIVNEMYCFHTRFAAGSLLMSCDSYFTKNKKDFYWVTFNGVNSDVDRYKPETNFILNSFKIYK